MKTIEGNKLIAEFMNIVYVPEDAVDYMQWNELMPVVEKIESLGFEFFIVENRSKVKFNTDYSIDVLSYLEGGSKIDITYQTVVEFIKWYNENK